MARFYGWTDDYIMSLDAITFSEYWRAITAVEGQEMLMQLKCEDWPQLKRHKRGELHKYLYKAAYPDTEDMKVKTVSTRGFADMLAGKLNG